MAIPDLPVEIVEIIVDHLHDDEPALKSCALVSHVYQRAAYYHLFRRISVESISKTPSLKNSLTPFGDLLLFARGSDAIREVIREIHLTNERRNHRIINYHAIQMLPNRFRSLETIIIEDIRLPKLEEFELLTIRPAYSLKKLVFVDVRGPEETVLLIISMFTTIDELHILDDGDLVSPESPSLNAPRRLPSQPITLGMYVKGVMPRVENEDRPLTSAKDRLALLSALRAKTIKIHSCLNFLQWMPSVLFTLEFLELVVSNSHTADTLNEFLPQATVLTHLRLDLALFDLYKYHRLTNDNRSVLDISSCTHLQSLSIRIHSQLSSGTFPKENASMQWNLLGILLSQVPSATTSITICLQVDHTEPPKFDILQLDWKAFNQALLRLEDLEELVFMEQASRPDVQDLSACGVREVWVVYLKDKLRPFYRTGKMRFFRQDEVNG